MPEFPFAHIIFAGKPDEVAKRTFDLVKSLHGDKGAEYSRGDVPFVVGSVGNDLLVAPFANYADYGIGAGDVLGHTIVKSKDRFDKINWEDCMRGLEQRMFPASGQGNLDLAKYIN
jgi:hypothetical protein